MARPQKTTLGTCKCQSCQRDVYVREAPGTGTISYTCIPCDWSPYFKPGTEAYRNLMKGMTPLPGNANTPQAEKAEPPQKPAPVATNPPPAPPKTKTTLFG